MMDPISNNLFHQPSPILALPAEIHQLIFSYLDYTALRQCALTCRRWTPSVQYILFRSARVSSSTAAHNFARTLRESPALRTRVLELTICGKLRDAVQPWICGKIDPIALLPGTTLLPRLRTLRLEFWDRVHFTAKFWTHLARLKTVVALHLRCCHFQSSTHIEDLVFAFPRLESLALDAVRWSGDRDRVFARREQYNDRKLELRKLYICNPYEYAPVFQWLIAHRCVNVRHLELVRFDVFNIRSAAAYVTMLGPVLESLTFGIYLPAACDPSARRLDLTQNTSLRSLSLQIYDVDGHSVRWVNSVLVSAIELPLARVALALTLDNGKTLWRGAWNAIHGALTAYWRPTLREVQFTHHAVPGFLKDVGPVFAERFPELVKREVMSVVVDTQDA
ncbi:hypothetical protein C8Q77DRAFT_782588 [Trametes polyzona]|nr:hypothetical protein C8Q77DRAFT_782588 [Trametes polyzona]